MDCKEWLKTEEGRMVSFYPLEEMVERTWSAAKKDALRERQALPDTVVYVLTLNNDGYIVINGAVTDEKIAREGWLLKVQGAEYVPVLLDNDDLPAANLSVGLTDWRQPH